MGAQKAFILKQGEDGMPVAEIYRKAGISQATYFNWKKNYGGAGGIRTHGTISGPADFKSAALDHSTTAPPVYLLATLGFAKAE